MSDILEKIRAAKVTAAENVVIEDLREKGLIPKEPGSVECKPHIMRWVAVSDAMPDIGENVLVYNTEGAVLVAKRMMSDWVAYFSDGEKRMGALKPTHWMPLPKPPIA